MTGNRLTQRFTDFQPFSSLVGTIAALIAAYQQSFVNTSCYDADLLRILLRTPKERAAALVAKPKKATWRRGIFDVSLDPLWRGGGCIGFTRRRPSDLGRHNSNTRANKTTSPFATLRALAVV